MEFQAGMDKCRNVSPEPTVLALGWCAHAVLGSAPGQTPMHGSTVSVCIAWKKKEMHF